MKSCLDKTPFVTSSQCSDNRAFVHHVLAALVFLPDPIFHYCRITLFSWIYWKYWFHRYSFYLPLSTTFITQYPLLTYSYISPLVFHTSPSTVPLLFLRMALTVPHAQRFIFFYNPSPFSIFSFIILHVETR